MRVYVLRKRLIVAAIGVLLLLGVGWQAVRFFDGVMPEVYVAGLRYTPRTAGEVRYALEARTRQPVSLVTPAGTWTFTPEQLGFVFDIEGALSRAAEAIDLSLGERIALWWRGAENARVDIAVEVTSVPGMLQASLRSAGIEPEVSTVEPRLVVTGGVPQVVPGRMGYRLDLDALAALLPALALSPYERTVEIPHTESPPSISNAELEAALDRLRLLSTFTTHYADDPSTEGRVANIELAASVMNGTVLVPGAEFSLNRLTGPRGGEDGYQLAPVIINGELVLGFGGGVSQVASTIFNAALLAGMRITEYHNHSIPVSYLPPGRDATVWYDTLDLRFVNPWGDFVAVQLRAEDGRLTVELWSPMPPDPLSVEIETELIEVTPAPVEERFDSRLAPGERVLEQSGRDGWRYAIRQKVYWGGELLEERVYYASYRPQTAIWRVGGEAR